jgi:hypothetical protein
VHRLLRHVELPVRIMRMRHELPVRKLRLRTRVHVREVMTMVSMSTP